MRIENINITIQSKTVAKGYFQMFENGEITIPADIAPISVTILARDQASGNFLMVSHNNERNGWELPAGHIEKNEKPWVSAARELEEETSAEMVGAGMIALGAIIYEKVSFWKRIFLSKEVRKILEQYPQKSAAIWFFAETKPKNGISYHPTEEETGVKNVRTSSFEELINLHGKQFYNPTQILESLKIYNNQYLRNTQ